MRVWLQEYFRMFGYTSEDTAELLSVFDAMTEVPQITELLSDTLSSYRRGPEYYRQESVLPTLEKLATANGIRYEAADLILLICLSSVLREHYRLAGIKDGIWYNTVSDLRYKNEECKCVRGYCGTFVAFWFNGFFNMWRFAFGRLQFEKIPFRRTATVGNHLLLPETNVINIHIPRSGKPFDRASRVVAYREAYAFYKDEFEDPCIPFVCHSWLLFPKHYSALKESSNIRSFMDEFDIIESEEYSDYSEVWRLFDKNYTGNVDDLPQDTSFRRTYADYIRRGEKTGEGLGVFFLQPEP